MADQQASSAGGAASASGNDYQNQVGAWLAVRILAERAAPLPWSLPEANGALEFLRCQTEQPVDDLLVGTSSGVFAFRKSKQRPKPDPHYPAAVERAKEAARRLQDAGIIDSQGRRIR